MDLLVPLFDDYKYPKKLILLGIYSFEEQKLKKLYSVTDAVIQTPYFNIPKIDKDELFKLLSTKNYFWNKKSLYKIGINATEWLDLNSCYWIAHYDKTPVIDEKLVLNFKHINQFVNFFKAINIPRPIVSAYPEAIETVIQASAIIDNPSIKIDGENSPSYHNHYTKTGRLHEILNQNISLKRETKKGVHTKGIKIDIDFDGCHTRIIDKLVWNNTIPSDISAIDYLMKELKTEMSRDEFKVAWNKMLYSEAFKENTHPLLVQLKNTYRKLKPLFAFGAKNFNYIIQQYEIYTVSKFVLSIPNDFYHSILFYTYDGISIDIKADKASEFFGWIQENVKSPVKIFFLEKTFFVCSKENSSYI